MPNPDTKSDSLSTFDNLVQTEKEVRKDEKVQRRTLTQFEKKQRDEIRRERDINNALQNCKEIRKRISELEARYLKDRRSLQLELEAAENLRDRAISVKV